MPIFQGTKRVGVFIGAAVVTAAVFVGVQVADPGGVELPPCPVTEQHTPGGPDGNGGCWPGDWNTGPSGTQTVLAPPTGDRYVYDGTVNIDSKIINYSILVRTGKTTITNSIINGTVEVYEPGAMDLIDSKIDGGNAYYATMQGWNYDLTRTEIFGGQQASICSGGCNWSNVYAHDPYYFVDQDAHQSAFATTGNTTGALMSVEHSTLWCNLTTVSPLGGGCTGNLALQPNFGPIENVIVNNNLMPVTTTGSYCLTGGYASSGYSSYAPLANHITITNNVFGKGGNGKCGVYGTSGSWNPSGTGNVWTGNKYTDGTTVAPNT